MPVLSQTTGPVLWSADPRGIATVTLNRPEVNNAYNGELIEGLLAALDALGGAAGLRAVVIKGNGKHFQAGADLKWIDTVRTSSPEENTRASRATAEAVQRLNLGRCRPSHWCRPAASAAAPDWLRPATW